MDAISSSPQRYVHNTAAGVPALEAQNLKLTEQIQAVTSLVMKGKLHEATKIVLQLRDMADQCKFSGNPGEFDQIYYALLDLAIQFKHEDINHNGQAVAAAIFGVLRFSETHRDILNREATIRGYFNENPNLLIDSDCRYIEYLTKAATMPGRPWAAYELGKMYGSGAIKTYCGTQKRDNGFEAYLFKSGYQSIAQEYINRNFVVSPDSNIKAIDAYVHATHYGSTLASQALMLLSITSNCPDTLFYLSRMITYFGVPGFTKADASALSIKAANCFANTKESTPRTTEQDRTAHYPKNEDGSPNKFHNNAHFKTEPKTTSSFEDKQWMPTDFF